jgi:hypothetical protein
MLLLQIRYTLSNAFACHSLSLPIISFFRLRRKTKCQRYFPYTSPPNPLLPLSSPFCPPTRWSIKLILGSFLNWTDIFLIINSKDAARWTVQEASEAGNVSAMMNHGNMSRYRWGYPYCFSPSLQKVGSISILYNRYRMVCKTAICIHYWILLFVSSFSGNIRPKLSYVQDSLILLGKCDRLPKSGRTLDISSFISVSFRLADRSDRSKALLSSYTDGNVKKMT